MLGFCQSPRMALLIQEQEQARRRDASPTLFKFAFLQKRKVGLVLLTR